MKKCFFVFLLVVCLHDNPLKAQTIPRDFWFWSTIGLDKKISKNFGASLDEELRLFDNASRINLFFTNVGVNYKLNRYFKFAIVYRFISKNRDGEAFSRRHRLYFDASYRHRLHDFNFIYRARLQGQVRDYNSSEKGKFIESYMRHKFDVQYHYKKYMPFVAAEFRMQFSNPRFNEGDDLWDRERFYIGCDYELNNKSSVGTYFMFQRDMNNQNLERDFVLGVEYSLSL